MGAEQSRDYSGAACGGDAYSPDAVAAANELWAALEAWESGWERGTVVETRLDVGSWVAYERPAEGYEDQSMWNCVDTTGTIDSFVQVKFRNDIDVGTAAAAELAAAVDFVSVDRAGVAPLLFPDNDVRLRMLQMWDLRVMSEGGSCYRNPGDCVVFHDTPDGNFSFTITFTVTVFYAFRDDDVCVKADVDDVGPFQITVRDIAVPLKLTVDLPVG